MRHKSTTDYQHFLDDLAGMYSFSVEEAVLIETIANCLDAKASVIKINVNKESKVFEIVDNGKGMDEKEFENYHNFSITFKEKGKGIGFAGLGAKLALRIAEKIITETFNGRHKFASCWEFYSKEPEWDDIKPTIIDKQGTLVRIYLKSADSLLLDDKKIESQKIIIKELKKNLGKLINIEEQQIKEQARKIASFDLFDQNASADWFDPEWMFGVVEGFDIVIGNPPYGNILDKDINKNTKKIIEKNFKYSTPSDISSPFIERGFNLLKEHGNLVFIITYAITFNKDFSKSRELLAKNFERVLIYTFDRDRCRIFKSMTQSVSILKCFNKNAPVKEGIYTSRMFRETPDINSIEITNCKGYLLPKNSNYSQSQRLPKIGEEINSQILEKLLRFNQNVEDIIKTTGSKIWIRTSGNYWYNAFDRKPYDSSEISFLYVDKDFADFIILLMNSSIFYFWFRIYGDGRHMNVDILESFPLPDREKILKFNILLNKVRTKFMDKLFSVFDKEHNRFITSSIKSEIDLIDLILGKYFYNLDYEEIIRILNYDFEVRGGCKLENTFYILVDQILSAKKQNPETDTSQLEIKIDQLVYELYDLTEEEIKIIENKK